MKLRVLFLSCDEDLKNCIKDETNGEKVALVFGVLKDLRNFRYNCNDIVYIIDSSKETTIEQLMILEKLGKSCRIFVFTTNIDESTCTLFLDKGAEFVLLKNTNVIISYLQMMIKNRNYYISSVRIDDFFFDPIDREIGREYKTIPINLCEVKLLRLLLHNLDSVVTFDDIAFQMGDGEFTSVKEYAKVYVHSLRRAFKDISLTELTIRNQYGVGYKLEYLGRNSNRS